MQISSTKQDAEQVIFSVLEQTELEVDPQQLLQMLQPIIELELMESKDEIPLGGSKFGGLPDLPEGFSYPIFENQALPFIAQINLKDVQFDETPLPKTGVLSFFANASTGGENPEARDAWKVYLFEEQALRFVDQPENLEEIFSERSFQSTLHWTLPGDFLEESYELMEVIEELPFMASNHYLLGGAQIAVQNNLSGYLLELAESGIRPQKANQEQIEAAKEKDDWMMLFSTNGMDTDMDWGSLHTLFFWIRRSDLKAQRFDRVWISGDVS